MAKAETKTKKPTSKSGSKPMPKKGAPKVSAKKTATKKPVAKATPKQAAASTTKKTTSKASGKAASVKKETAKKQTVQVAAKSAGKSQVKATTKKAGSKPATAKKSVPTKTASSKSATSKKTGAKSSSPKSKTSSKPAARRATSRVTVKDNRDSSAKGKSTQAIAASNGTPLLEVEGLKKHFPIQKGVFSRTVGQVYAVDGVSFSLGEGETLGLVGESGCGKSTTGKVVLKLIEPTAGSIKLRGKDLTHLSRREMRPYRREMQIIFQDPYSSLNPRMSAASIVGEPFAIHSIATGSERDDRVAALFKRVGLREDQRHNFPHEFSGGQRQRIGIARALALNPSLIVGDEPVSALDVSIQAQVINLLMDLQEEYKLSYLFIAHDLAVVEHISHRIAVMYLGKIVEHTDKRTLFTSPLHPYTEALLSAVPIPDPSVKRDKRILLEGDVPSPINPPSGCHFHTRCPYAKAECRVEVPELKEVKKGHWVSCLLR